jgi:hypothetical protein
VIEPYHVGYNDEDRASAEKKWQNLRPGASPTRKTATGYLSGLPFLVVGGRFNPPEIARTNLDRWNRSAA